MRYETREDEAKGRHGVKRYIAWIRGLSCGFPVLKSDLDHELRRKLRRGLDQIPDPRRPRPEIKNERY